MTPQRLYSILSSYDNLAFDISKTFNILSTQYTLVYVNNPTRTQVMNYAARMSRYHSE